MPPKATTQAPKAPAKDRDLDTDQHLYAIILQMGTPSGGEAWNEVAERMPYTPGGQAARHRWGRLKAKWDAVQLFGDDQHFDIVEKADRLRGQPKMERKKKAETETKKAKGKGKGSEKRAGPEAKETEGSDGVEEQDGVSDKDDDGEGSSRAAAAKKPRAKKSAPKPASVEDGEESGVDTAIEMEG